MTFNKQRRLFFFFQKNVIKSSYSIASVETNFNLLLQNTTFYNIMQAKVWIHLTEGSKRCFDVKVSDICTHILCKLYNSNYPTCILLYFYILKSGSRLHIKAHYIETLALCCSFSHLFLALPTDEEAVNVWSIALWDTVKSYRVGCWWEGRILVLQLLEHKMYSLFGSCEISVRKLNIFRAV